MVIRALLSISVDRLTRVHESKVNGKPATSRSCRDCINQTFGNAVKRATQTPSPETPGFL